MRPAELPVPAQPIEILHLEDDPRDAERTLQTLRDEGIECAETRVATRAAFQAALERSRPAAGRPPFDLLLADYGVPDLPGDESLALAQKLRPDLPFIFISGKMGEELAVEMLHAGATDYVLKPRLSRLPFAVLRALYERRLERERAAVLEHLTDLSARLERRTLLDEVLEQMPAGVVVAEAPDGRVLAFNETARRLFGLARPVENVTEIARAPVFLPDGQRATPHQLPSLRALESGEVVRDLVLEVRPTTGKSVFVQASSAPLRDAVGKVVGAVTTYTDVTSGKLMQDALRQQVEFREHLLAIVSHDLRSPLGAIGNAAYVLARRAGGDELAAKSIATIQRSVGRMTGLIRDLLDFARTRLGGELPLSRRRTDLAVLLGAVLDEARAVHPERTLELAASGGAFAEVDPDRFQQALTNLVANAVAYGTPGRPIRLALREAAGVWEVEVWNEGPPIPPEALPTLFEPFQRGPHRQGDRNVGLGLYIVDQIVRAHGGEIDVRSSAEYGTAFTVRIPAQPSRGDEAALH
jgi:PAS domain S-box-containing protein